LLVATAGRVQRWTPADVAELPGISPRAEYRALAFDPNGQMLWAAPSADDRDDAWTSSDVLDPDSGVIGTGPRWDTAMVTHPGGALLLTLQSDQGATLGLFARVDQSTEPVSWRVLRRALILDADGYEAPVFSSDGRHLAVRGNAYENSLEVFEFPSLNRVLATTLGDPNPGYPYPAEWLEQRAAWSRQNIAFASEPGMLWVGTPDGALLEIDIDGERASRHDVLDRAPIAALAASQGQLVVATSASELVIVNIRRESIESRDVQPDALVQAFLESTSDAPDDFDWEQQLLVTDGTDSWDPNDLERVTKAKPSDPTWLQLKAAINTARDGNA
jgi:hypothetical protein